MSKLAARLFVALAVVAGGFLALTNTGTASAPLPSVPTATNPTSAAQKPDADDLGDWQETRLTVGKPSNIVPTKK